MANESVEQRLVRLGIQLPESSPPAANYVNLVEVNGLVFVAGKGPYTKPKGKGGRDFTTEQAYQYAREAGMQVLATVQAELGSLDRIQRVVKIVGYINATEAFEDHHLVLDGCSDLMVEVFGDKGHHARSVLGAMSLRGGLPVVIDSVFAVDRTGEKD
jgi:enamine deaminase RidA (YjgF/YER057c/UK114 family)